MPKKCKKINSKTNGSARHKARKMEKRYGVPYNSYFCKICQCWHVGRIAKENIAAGRKLFLQDNPAVIGIDPGKTGALALICSDVVEIYDYIDILSAASLVSRLKEKYNVRFAIIEKVWIWKNEKDVKTAEALIRNAQTWATLLAINKITFETYPPVTWRKGFVSKKDMNKEGYIKIAINIFPEYEHILYRHDRAEALLIAYRAWKHIEAGMPTQYKIL
jgi:Holliday junction resolvasome RuvABC endonuclease subunit